MYKFYMPIGDWSDDGHGRVENFLVQSNKPVEAVREAHFQIPTATGVSIEDICSGYQDNTISDITMAKLTALGWTIEHGFQDQNRPSIRDMANLWCLLLMKADPELNLELEPEELEISMLPFYGMDEKGRHIHDVGYGLF